MTMFWLHVLPSVMMPELRVRWAICIISIVSCVRSNVNCIFFSKRLRAIPTDSSVLRISGQKTGPDLKAAVKIPSS